MTVPGHVRPDLVVHWDFWNDESIYEDIWLNLGKMREKYPIFYSDAHDGFWVLTRHADIERMFHLEGIVSAEQLTIPPSPWPRKAIPSEIDPPEHGIYRRILVPLFAREKLVRLTEDIREISRELCGQIRRQGECEFVADFASVLPTRIFLRLMGLADEQAPTFLSWTYDLIHASDPEVTGRAMGNLIAFFADQIASRQANPAATG